MGVRGRIGRYISRRRGDGSVHEVIRKAMRLTQSGAEVEVVVVLVTGAVAKQIHVRSATGQWVPIASFEPVTQPTESNAFAARFSWADPTFISVIKAALPDDSGQSSLPPSPQPLDLFVEVLAPAHRFTESPQPGDVFPSINDLAGDQSTPVRGWLTLGRFERTDMAGRAKYSVQGTDYLIYPRQSGNLALAVGVMPRPVVRVDIKKALIEHDAVSYEGTLYTHHTEPTSLLLAFEGRDSETTISVPLDVREDTSHPAVHWGHRSYEVSGKVPLTEFLDKSTTDDIFTTWIFVSAQDITETHRARVGNSRYRERRRANEAWVERGDRAVLVSAYYTFVASKLSLTVEHFETPQLRQMLTGIGKRRKRRLGHQSQKPVWLIGEQKYKAQDTGLAFFKFMRENHREIDAYYVIAQDAADRVNLDGIDHVVDFRSHEHLELFFRAERIVTSHHPEYIYPSKSRMLGKAVSPVRVFLQHGVFGVRRLDKLYGRQAPGFHTDLFLVSSAREKRNAVTDLGYRPDEVAVTGLSRFDTLFDETTVVKNRQILIMPTWREWLQTEHSFLNSLYLAHWKELLNLPRFAQLLDDHDAEAVLLLHPNMRMYVEHFESARVRLVRHGQQPVQQLLKESGILITDYSSVGFDFSFLHKPVLFYQFDSAKFMREGSHIDLDADLPGPILWTQKGLLEALGQTLDRDARMEPEYERRATDLLSHKDLGNGERIFEAVSAAQPRRESFVDRYFEVLASAERVARQRSAYDGVMGRFFAVWKLLPVRDDVIVFDAAGSTREGDSAKAIYDELVRRGDTRTKIWIHDGKIKVSDDHTRVIRRLSPAHYWYLARAKYWISNTHMPEQIKRRSSGVFLQSRHGTPLVKQLHDRVSTHPRDKKLLDQHAGTVGQWSHLLSPSPFATEVFATALKHEAEILELGDPRTDTLTADDAVARGSRVRQKLGISAQQTSVFYAPTCRFDRPAGKGRFHFEPPFTLTEMADNLGPDHVLLVRLHPLMADDLRIPDDYVGRIINVSSYANLNDLYLASDVMITDYSSVLFDYAVLQRPIVFLAYDLDQYRDAVGGFYLDYEHELPGPVVRDVHGLSDALARECAHPTDRTEFLSTFAPHAGGGAAGRVVDRIFGRV